MFFMHEPIVIVIDPGHGGENLGAEYGSFTEKDMTMILAKAMQEELQKYDNVEVYLTHEKDVDMSIEDRASFAAEKDADFLFCLHFNASINHDLFGAETWVPASGDFYAKGYSFSEIEMEALSALGLYSRGIKTKLNDSNENYYGILRYCTQYNVPSVLIEHCHLDHAKDKGFYENGEEQLKALGILDATSAAKYFQLSSTQLNVDYSDYIVPPCAVPEDIVRPDLTPPEVCNIEVIDCNEQTGEVTIRIKAEDKESYILYFNYSLDGGNTYYDLIEWPRTDVWNQSLPENTFTVTVPFGESVELRVNAYNGYDVWSESNIVKLEPIEEPVIEIEEIVYEEPQSEHNEMTAIWMTVGAVIGLLFLTIIIAKTVHILSRGKRKR